MARTSRKKWRRVRRDRNAPTCAQASTYIRATADKVAAMKRARIALAVVVLLRCITI